MSYNKKNHYSKMVCRLLALALSLNLPVPAFATTTTTALSVSATVLSVCGVATTPLAFGNYSATNVSPLDASSIITATCSNGVSYTIALDAGIGSGGTVASRILTSGAHTLNYTIYTNTGHSTIWGDGTGGTATQSYNSGDGLSSTTYNVYGLLPKGQYVSAGLYGDTLTVTVTY